MESLSHLLRLLRFPRPLQRLRQLQQVHLYQLPRLPIPPFLHRPSRLLRPRLYSPRPLPLPSQLPPLPSCRRPPQRLRLRQRLDPRSMQLHPDHRQLPAKGAGRIRPPRPLPRRPRHQRPRLRLRLPLLLRQHPHLRLPLLPHLRLLRRPRLRRPPRRHQPRCRSWKGRSMVLERADSIPAHWRLTARRSVGVTTEPVKHRLLQARHWLP